MGSGDVWLARPPLTNTQEWANVDYMSTNIFLLTDGGTIVTTHSFGAGFLRDLTYDSTNNGFFIIREFDSPLAETTEEYNMGYEAERTYTTHWIDAEDLAIHDVQTIGPVPIGGGMGCEQGEFSSEPGKIMYTGLSCFTLPDGVGANDTLTFTLP